MVRGASRNLLGVDEIYRLNLIAVVNSLTTKVASFNPFEVYPKLFEGLGTMHAWDIQNRVKAGYPAQHLNIHIMNCHDQSEEMAAVS